MNKNITFFHDSEIIFSTLLIVIDFDHPFVSILCNVAEISSVPVFDSCCQICLQHLFCDIRVSNYSKNTKKEKSGANMCYIVAFVQ